MEDAGFEKLAYRCSQLDSDWRQSLLELCRTAATLAIVEKFGDVSRSLETEEEAVG